MKRKNVSPGNTDQQSHQQLADQSLQLQFAVRADHQRNTESVSQEQIAGMNSSFLQGFGSQSVQRPKSRHNSPTPPTGSFEQQQLHRMVKMKKQSLASSQLDESRAKGSPNSSAERADVQLASSAVALPQQYHQAGRINHQQARTMRISQQRILRESSLETVPPGVFDQQAQHSKNHVIKTVVAKSDHDFSNSISGVHQRNFASEGLSFSSLTEQTGQKLVKKVVMKGYTGGSISNNNNVAGGQIGTTILTAGRQQSTTQRQGPILQAGPHIRSKSSAVSGDAQIQLQARTSRKSNSRGRATPQNRMSQLQAQTAMHQQHIRKQKKTSEIQNQKSSITITSPKDSSADLNTSLPLPLSKSQNRMAHLDKNQTSVGNGKQHQVFKPATMQTHTAAHSGQWQQNVQSLTNQVAKATVTPTGTHTSGVGHTRKQSSTRHRSNSKKRGSINTSIRRQISRSPGGGQRSNSLHNSSMITNAQPAQQVTQNSKASVKNNQSAQMQSVAQATQGTAAKTTATKLNSVQWSKEPASIAANQMVAALAASAFNQQHAKSMQGKDMQAAKDIQWRGTNPTSKPKLLQGSSQNELNEKLVLAVSAALNNPPQGHRLTPLVQSSKTGRSSNERKNKSMLYEASSLPDPESHKSESKLSEPAQKLVGVDLQNSTQQQHQGSSVDDLQNIGIQKLQQFHQSAADQDTTNMMKQNASHSQANQLLLRQGGKEIQAVGKVGAASNQHNSNRQQKEAHQQQQAASSQFSSFAKYHDGAMNEARHQSAQKILRPKNSLNSATGMSSQSPNGGANSGVVRRVAAPAGASQSQMNSVYVQQNAQFMNLIKPSRQGLVQNSSSNNPVTIQSRKSHNLPQHHQQSTTSSAQSSRTANDVYLKQALKNNLINGPDRILPTSHQTKTMSSRTINSASSSNGATPYEPGRAQTAQAMVQETYGSSSAVNKHGVGMAAVSSEKQQVSFHDFRPKTSFGGGAIESKSQMMLDRDVEGLSPEPRAEIILTKNQIQRAQKSKLQGQSQILSIGKQESRSQNQQKLMKSQIQQANQTFQKEAAKKVIKSQRAMQTKHHAKSFSNSQSGQNNLNFEQKNMQAVNNAYLNNALANAEGNQKPSNATGKQRLVNQQPSAQSLVPNSKQQMVQNWMNSSDQEAQPENSKKSTFRQIGLQQAGRQKFAQQPPANTYALAVQDILGGQNSKSQRGVAQSSSIQSAVLPQQKMMVENASFNNQQYNTPFMQGSFGDDQTHSQKILKQTTNHQLSHGQAPQHLKSVQVQASSSADKPHAPSQKVLRTGRSTKESILQAEQSHQKILGPPVHHQASSNQEESSMPDSQHNAYANNAEDYHLKKQKAQQKKVSGNKTPGDKQPKKNFDQASTTVINAGQGALSLKKKTSAKASPQTHTQLLEEESNRLMETQSALTVTAPHSLVSQGSHQQNNAASTSNSVIHDNKSMMSRSRLSQFVQSNAMKQGSSAKNSSSIQQSTSNGSQSNKTASVAGNNVVRKTVLASNQVQIVQSEAKSRPNQQKNADLIEVTQLKQAQTQKSSQKQALTQSELMRKKNVAKMVGASALSQKQQMNLQMQHIISKKEDGANTGSTRQGQKPDGTGVILKKDPDQTLLSTSTLSKFQQSKASPKRLPRAIHQQLKNSSSNSKQVINNPANNARYVQAQSSEKIYASQQSTEDQRAAQDPSGSNPVKLDQQQQKLYHEFLQNSKSQENGMLASSEKRSRPNNTSVIKQNYYKDGRGGAIGNVNSEARSQTAMLLPSKQNSHEGSLLGSRYNMGQPAQQVTDFNETSTANHSRKIGGDMSSTPNSSTLTVIHQYNANFQYSGSLARYPHNELMPQRNNLANMLEKVDKKLPKNEMLMTTQLASTTHTSQSSSSHKTRDDDTKHHKQQSSVSNRQGVMNASGRLNKNIQQSPSVQQQVINHLVTFEAHTNSVVGLQATHMSAPNQFASLGKDNSVKVWSVTTQKPTELISNNRAAAVNLPPKVVLKRQIKNQARPSQKLSSFAFMTMGQGAQQQQLGSSVSLNDHQGSVLVTGCTDKVLRLYALDQDAQAAASAASTAGESSAFQRLNYAKRKDGHMASADIMQPTLKLTGQHGGVISSIVQLDQRNDLFLTGCSDGLVRMYSLSALSEETDGPLRSFDQVNTGVQQICTMSESTFLSSGYDNSVRLWDVRAQEPITLLKDANIGKVTWLKKYNQSIFASACKDGLINFWDIRKMKLYKQVTMPAHGSISSVQFAKKLKYMIVAHDHKLSVINISADQRAMKQQHHTFSVIANQEDRPLSKVDPTNHALSTENSWGSGAKITSMVYSEADKKVYMGGFNKKITVLNLNLDGFS